ncbi:hypothetical protein GCM10011365_15040 [Marinicella pacifica]|uniref:Uncharacterized protein n=1 Tax=Marinicella pacifica TaxID=1171543 RepID=A0A917CRB0_9GAMM|nr:hypothetical protein [Marinicella pacifica]GGF94721.1 hypothetical protein GCM10011365_15040 [Marinicella pacifica]
MIFLPLFILAALLVALFRWVTYRQSEDRFYRLAWLIFLVGVFLLFWSNGAVGIIGASNNDINMLYNALLGLGLVGGIGFRKQRLGLTLLMLVLDFLMFMILAVALVGNMGHSGPKWPLDAVILTVFFSGFWSAAAVLFYLSNRRRIRLGLG